MLAPYSRMNPKGLTERLDYKEMEIKMIKEAEKRAGVIKKIKI